VAAIHDRGFEDVAPVLRRMAREPVYADLFADQASARIFKATALIRRLRQLHPDYDLLRSQLIRTEIKKALVRQAEADIARQDSLNYAMAFRFHDSPELMDWVREYLGIVAKIRDRDRSRVQADIRILMTPEEFESKREDLRQFRDFVTRSPIAEILVINPEAPEVDAFVLERFLEKNGNALVYGMPDLPLAASYANRLVRSDVGEEDTFLVAALLSKDLAEVKGEVDERLLARISSRVPGLRFDGRNIEITTLALELALRYQATEHIATMA
jgi:hypothetical protein